MSPISRLLRTGLVLAALAPAALPAQPVEEVPFVISPDNVTLAMLQIARVGPEDFLIDLGSGDGRIVITAAKRFGARGLGVEIVPDLVEKSREAARQARVAERAIFREQDLFRTDLSPASVVTMYLLPDVNLKLRPKLLQLRPGTRVVSHDWDLGDWEPDKSVRIEVPDKPVGLEKASRIHLWIVPARIDGNWCGVGRNRGTALHIDQSYQKVRGGLADANDQRSFEGRIEGAIVRIPGGLTFTFDGTRLKATYAAGKFAPLKGATFARRRGAACP